jgi:hypothetical protein
MANRQCHKTHAKGSKRSKPGAETQAAGAVPRHLPLLTGSGCWPGC